ncbi:MAG: LacI family DNA-binding transcriptional regulator [Devosia nanyangense]|uniref:LacI family DNA-binding transcriptional regulator n=1 Tax=Devosia nanyangense TaxID=1228055 RepID=A0A933NXY9_9HYPH|nr:LacI family DNA-binding transcriptional regulator [Devosia nanyangense]
MATIRDVARRAGVAISTVSLALNGKGPISPATVERIQAVAAQMGYMPSVMAQSLKRGHNRLIGLVLGDIGNPFFGRLLRNVDSVVAEADHMLIVADTASHPEREINTLNQLRRHRVGGIIMAPLSNDPAFAAYLREIDVPVVLIDQYVDGVRLDYVCSDNELTTTMLTEYLIRLGHRRICYLGGQPNWWTARLRLAGFRAAMQASGVNIDPDLEVVADFDGEKAYDQVARLLSRPKRPTAIVAASNLMALGALQAINDLGFSCPGDVSLTGVDDVPWGSVIKPRITTVVQPVEELAQVAAAWILERIGSRGGAAAPPRTHVAIPRLVIGESCSRV